MTQADSVLSTPPTNTSGVPNDNPPSAPAPRPPFNMTLEPFAGFGDRDQPGMPQYVRDAIATIRKARSEAADEIERLLGFLNETELDYEENEIDALFRARFGDQPFEEEIEEREPEPEHDELGGDDEPSLGASNSINQNDCGNCESNDLELDHCDDEPSLCGLTVERGDDQDREDSIDDHGEEDAGENGVADLDGLAWVTGANYGHGRVEG